MNIVLSKLNIEMLDISKLKGGKQVTIGLFFFIIVFLVTFSFGQNTKLESYGLKGKVMSVKEYSLDSISYNGQEYLNYKNGLEIYFNEKGYVTNIKYLIANYTEEYLYNVKNICTGQLDWKDDSLVYKTVFYRTDTSIIHETFKKELKPMSKGYYKVDGFDRIVYEISTSDMEDSAIYKEITILKYDKYSQAIYSLLSANIIKIGQQKTNEEIEDSEPMEMGGSIEIEYLKFDKSGNWIKCIRKSGNGFLMSDTKQTVVRKIKYY